MPTVLDHVTPADVRMEPFPHVVVRHPLRDWGAYRVLEQAWPAIDTRGVEPNRAARLGAAELRARPCSDADKSAWQYNVVDPHVSPEFWWRFWSVFGFAVERTWGVQRAAELFNKGPVGVRREGSPKVQLDCQFVVNTPTPGGTTVRDPHVDNPCELYAGLWYFRHPDDDSSGGDLVLYRTKWAPSYHRSEFGKGSVSEDQVEEAVTIPYEEDLLVFFLNGPNSVHGVTPRGPAYRPRRYVNIIAEVDPPLFSLSKGV